MTKTTTKNVINGLQFDTDLGGLHKPEQVIVILGKKLRFFEPSTIQQSLMFNFLLTALKDVVATKYEQDKLTIEELRNRIGEKLLLFSQPAGNEKEEEEKQKLLSYMFTNAEANKYLVDAITDCFPDLNAKLLTDEALVDVTGILLDCIPNNVKKNK